MAIAGLNPLQSRSRSEPKTVLGAAKVNLALVAWCDEDGQEYVQLAVVGKNNVTMLDTRSLGFGKIRTPAGEARAWLRDGIFEKLEQGENDASAGPS